MAAAMPITLGDLEAQVGALRTELNNAFNEVNNRALVEIRDTANKVAAQGEQHAQALAQAQAATLQQVEARTVSKFDEANASFIAEQKKSVEEITALMNTMRQIDSADKIAEVTSMLQQHSAQHQGATQGGAEAGRRLGSRYRASCGHYSGAGRTEPSVRRRDCR